MAEKQDFGGLSSAMDLSKLPLYGASEDQIKELRDAQQQALTALEQRYAQPNWFKVAAGFAKPQLGGFIASLGSAADALGENIEQQRAQQLPIAQMRSALAQSNLLLGKNQSVNAKIEAWKAAHPGQMPSAAQVMEWRAESPTNPTVQSIAEQQGIATTQQGQAMQILKAQLDTKQITLAQYNEALARLSLGSQLAPQGAGTPSAATPTAAAPVAGAPAPVAATGAPPGASENEPVGRFKGDPAQILAGIKAIKDPVERDRAMQAFQNQMQYGMAPEPGMEEKKPSGPYPMSFVPPDVSNLNTAVADATLEGWKANAAKEENRIKSQLEDYSRIATGPIYDTVNTAYNSAIDLIEKNPQMAKKVFNLIRGEGGVRNQIMASLQSGLGFNLGSTSANISLPIGTFMSAGLNPAEQQYADALVNAMLTVGNSKLLAQGISPEKGREAYFTNLMTKASLDQNPATALHILHKDRVNFDKSKRLYDTAIAEHNERKVDPNSLTPFTDIFRNSPQLKKIQQEAEEKNATYERQYREYLDQEAKKRSKKP